MKYSKACKLCKIGFAEPKTLDKIHNLRFKKDYPLRTMEAEVNKLIKTSANPKISGLKTISYPAIQNHFAKHTSSTLTSRYKTQNIMKATTGMAQNLDAKQLMPQVSVGIRKLERDRINLVDDLSSLYETIKERFELFDEEQGGRIDLGLPGEKGNLDGYSVLSKELRACLAELNKIKQAEQLSKNVVHFCLKHFTKIIIEETIKELDSFKKMLIPQVKDVEAMQQIVNSIQHNIGTTIVKGANDTLQKTTHQFNID